MLFTLALRNKPEAGNPKSTSRQSLSLLRNLSSRQHTAEFSDSPPRMSSRASSDASPAAFLWADGASLGAAETKNNLPELSSSRLPPKIRQRFMQYCDNRNPNTPFHSTSHPKSPSVLMQKQKKALGNRKKLLQERQQTLHRRLLCINARKKQLAARQAQTQALLRAKIAKKLQKAAERNKWRNAAHRQNTKKLMNHAQNMMQRLDIAMKRRLEHHKKHLVAEWKKTKSKRQNAQAATPAGSQHDDIQEALEMHSQTIQAAWRLRRMAAAHKKLLAELGTPALLGLVSVEAIQEKIQRPRLIEAADVFLGCFDGAADGRKQNAQQAKMLLSALVLRESHGAALVGDEGGAEAKRLLCASSALVDCLVRFELSAAFRSAFCNALRTFSGVFEKWRVRDRNALKSALNDFLGELQSLRQTVANQHDYEADWKPRLDHQQRIVSQRIQQLFSSESPRTRAADATSEISEISETAETSADAPPAPKPPAPQKQQPQPLSAAAKDWFVFGRLSKHQLIHEIFMQDQFRLEDFLLSVLRRPEITDFDDFLRQNKAKLLEALGKADLQSSDSAAVLQIISYLRSRLVELAPHKGPYRREIEEFIDLDHIQLQISQNALDVPRLMRFCVGMMKKFCAPVRDAELSALQINLEDAGCSRDYVFVLVELVQTLDRMTFDMINFMANALKNHITFAVVEYERGARENEDLLLDEIRRHLAAYREREGDLSPDSLVLDAGESKRQQLRRRLCLFYVDVLGGERPVPSFLSFDETRIKNLCFSMRRIAVISAVATLFASQLSIPPERFVSLAENNAADLNQIHSESLAILHEHDQSAAQPLDKKFRKVIVKILASIIQQNETLFDLFMRRQVEMCRTHFVYGHYSLLNSGMGWLCVEPNRNIFAERVLEPFEKVFDLNFKVYEDLYEKAFFE